MVGMYYPFPARRARERAQEIFELTSKLRRQKTKNLKEDIFSTEKKYDIIYADPPWRFRTYSDKGKGRSADKHYPTMEKSAIQTLPIERLSKRDSVLLLWVTAPCLIEGFELIEAWGFTYKTVAFTWLKQCRKSDKIFTGMGSIPVPTQSFAYWQHEEKFWNKNLARFLRW